jgi:hypothetical protein
VESPAETPQSKPNSLQQFNASEIIIAVTRAISLIRSRSFATAQA